MDRKTIFGIILMLLFGFACMRFYSKCTGGKSIFGDNIAPQSEWKDILIGEWEFETDLVFPTFRKEFRGTVEYLPNGTFIRRVHIICAYYKENIGGGHSRIEYFKAGGTVKGKWEIGKESNWIEKTKECNITESFNSEKVKYAPCEDFKSKNEGTTYGYNLNDYEKTTIYIFNKNKISMKSKVFENSNKEENIYTFKRIK